MSVDQHPGEARGTYYQGHAAGRQGLLDVVAEVAEEIGHWRAFHVARGTGAAANYNDGMADAYGTVLRRLKKAGLLV